MNRTHVAVVITAIAAVLWVGLSAQQEMLSRPGPGSGVMNVNVLNQPTIAAAQTGQWVVMLGHIPDVRLAGDVRIGNTPNVTVMGPAFLSKSGTYAITWNTGETERLTLEVGPDGWGRVSSAAGASRRWVNLNTARAVEEVR